MDAHVDIDGAPGRRVGGRGSYAVLILSHQLDPLQEVEGLEWGAHVIGRQPGRALEPGDFASEPVAALRANATGLIAAAGHEMLKLRREAERKPVARTAVPVVWFHGLLAQKRAVDARTSPKVAILLSSFGEIIVQSVEEIYAEAQHVHVRRLPLGRRELHPRAHARVSAVERHILETAVFALRWAMEEPTHLHEPLERPVSGAHSQSRIEDLVLPKVVDHGGTHSGLAIRTQPAGAEAVGSRGRAIANLEQRANLFLNLLARAV
mmetsp:Transcript_5693/g.22478  ORF Transcript_5693/g.22478 Transcript_5693/m.22478 type:complete len:265 (-) Transcript_5693:620-1414(-)